MKEEDEDEDNEERKEVEKYYPPLSSLDILAYGYLKEEMVNTSDSKEVKI